MNVYFIKFLQKYEKNTDLLNYKKNRFLQVEFLECDRNYHKKS